MVILLNTHKNDYRKRGSKLLNKKWDAIVKTYQEKPHYAKYKTKVS